MNSLLAGQQIKKRKPQSFDRKNKQKAKSAKPAAYRPECIISTVNQNNRFIDKIKQEPVPNKREVMYRVPNKRRPSSRIRLPSLTIPAATAFFLVTGICLIIYSQDRGLNWASRQVVNQEVEQNSQTNLARYVGIGPEEISRGSVSIYGNIPENNTPENNNTDIIPLDLTETFAWQSYTVRRGDSVSGIAANFAVSMDAIIASNGITNARALREGEVLRIPNMDGIPYTVREGDSLSKISLSMEVPLEAILDANDIQSDIIRPGTTLFIPGARMNREELRLALGELFIYPVRSARLSSPFGWRNDPFTGVRRHHAAIDLSAPQGTQIMAAMDGRVSAIGYDRTYGNFIILNHSGGFQTLYAHLHTVQVKNGDQVRQGVLIGTVGSTGYSTGPHLHFAVFRNGRAVNPIDFLSSNR